MSANGKLEDISAPPIERQSIEADIACVGFGPAMGGFLTTLTRAWNENPADPAFEKQSRARSSVAGDLLRARGRYCLGRKRCGDGCARYSRKLS